MGATVIQSVNRAIQILGLFSLAKPQLGITEISRALKLHKGTVQGLVRTLTDQGFLEQDHYSRKYQLGPKVYELGIIRAGSLEINQKASIPAHQLALRTERLVRIATWDKNSCVGNSWMSTLDHSHFSVASLRRASPHIVRAWGRLSWPSWRKRSSMLISSRPYSFLIPPTL